MSFQARLSHAAAVTKWKADQQMRVLKCQNQIRDLEGQIKVQKSLLADTALSLYTQQKLTHEELIQICNAISQLHSQIKDQHNLEDMIKQERGPELSSYSASYPPAVSGEVAAEATSGLVCPQCNRPLRGRFCPEHGVEGVPAPSQPTQEGG